MLKLLGTISAVAAAVVVLEKRMNAGRPTELEVIAAEELRKVLLYAAPPTFLARVSSLDDSTTGLRWLDRASGN